MKLNSVCCATAFLVLNAALVFAEENRWEAAIRQFEAADAANPPKPGGIVFVGSSTIRFWPTAEDFPELGVVNRGFGGSQTADAVHYVDRIVIKYQPRLVVFYEGDNDLSYGKSPETVFADTVAFFEKVHAALPDANIIHVSIKPSIARWNLIDKIRATNALVREYAANHDYIHYFDTEPLILGQDGKPRLELFVSDGLHFSREGYDVLNEILEPLLKVSPGTR
jgi:lysophospholipase L1-like esterase